MSSTCVLKVDRTRVSRLSMLQRILTTELPCRQALSRMVQKTVLIAAAECFRLLGFRHHSAPGLPITRPISLSALTAKRLPAAQPTTE